MPDAPAGVFDHAGIHLSVEALAAYLDGRLPANGREAAHTHFAECATCRREMIELRGMLPSRRRLSRKAAISALAALAAVLAITVAPPLHSRRGAQPAATRAATSPGPLDATTSLQTVAPGDGAEVTGVGLQFAWRSAGDGVAYRFTVQDATGGVVFRTQTGDTAVVLPAGVALRPGDTYYWSVEARLVDGRSTRSGLHRFRQR